ncbi:MAG: tetratricopeptide repeat protein [Planctomycetota bacterium]
MLRWMVPLIAAFGFAWWWLMTSDEPAAAKGFATRRPADAGAPSEAGERAQRYWADAETAVATGELERGRVLLEGYLKTEAPAAVVLELLSTIARRQGDAATALAYAENAVELAPQRSSAYVAKALALQKRLAGMNKLRALLHAGDLEATTARAVELDPQNVAALVHRAHFLLYAPSVAGGDLDAVSDIATQLASLDPAQATALDALVLHRRGRIDDAIARCRAGLDEHPRAQQLHWILGRLLNEVKDREGAEAAFRAALHGEDDEARYNASYKLAKLLIQDGREHEEAVALLTGFLDGLRRTDLQNVASAAHWWIGQAHEGLGRVDAARAAYAEALRLDEGFAQARVALDKLKPLDRDR